MSSIDPLSPSSKISFSISQITKLKEVTFTIKGLITVSNDGSSTEVDFERATSYLTNALYLDERFPNELREGYTVRYTGRDGTTSDVTPNECLGKFLLDHLTHQQVEMNLRHIEKLARMTRPV